VAGCKVGVILHGYKYSVYSWIARFALAEKGIDFTWLEVDPFAEHVSAQFLKMHPFRRVPVLDHNGFILYETQAITRYVNDAFEGPNLMPPLPQARARCDQIIGIIDSYAYRPLVRQVYSHGVFRKLAGDRSDDTVFQEGLAASRKILAALESLASGGDYLVSGHISLADIHLAPMIGYYSETFAGAQRLGQYPGLSAWWADISQRESFLKTRPPAIVAPTQ
jgi:glutathione S-transferase